MSPSDQETDSLGSLEDRIQRAVQLVSRLRQEREAFAAVLVPVITNTVWPASADSAPQTTTAFLGQEIMGTYALPFEVAGVLLLVALVGAIIVARER